MLKLLNKIYKIIKNYYYLNKIKLKFLKSKNFIKVNI